MQEFIVKTSPYVRKETSTKRMMIDVLIALMPSVIFAVYKFGFRALWLVLVSVVTMVAVEAIFIGLVSKGENGTFLEKVKQRYKKFSINNITAPAVSGVIFALLLPDQISFYVVILGAVFGIAIGKMVFGGLGSNTFNPAALARVFIALAFASFFQNAYSFVDVAAGATPLGTGFENLFNSYSISDLFFGNIPGSIGEVNSLAILIGAAYLFIRRSADFRPALAALVIFTALTLVVATLSYPSDRIVDYLLYQILSGGLLFGLAFMITDPVTSPVTKSGRITYGLIVGTIVFMIRQFGVLPEGVAFAILMGNMFVPLLDYPKWAVNKYSQRFIIVHVAAICLLVLATFLVVGGYVI